MKERFYLTNQEIGDTIVEYIGKTTKGIIFFPYKIKRAIARDDGIEFELEYVPKGTLLKDAQHNWLDKEKR